MNQMIERTRGTRRAGARAGLLVALLFGVVACGDDTAAPSAPRLPPHVSAALRDARIGLGVPEQFRATGIEHNRLTLLTARQLRGEASGFRDAARRCAAVQRVMLAEAGRTAGAIGIPDREHLLRSAFARAMRGRPGCVTFGPFGGASLSEGVVSASAEGDSIAPSAAAFAALDAFAAAIEQATSPSAVQAALQSAATAASTMTELDAAAVYAAIAQTQASIVLWEPGGAGWIEIDPFGTAESLFPLASSGGLSDWAIFKLAIGADLAGCLGALGFMRRLPILQDPRLLIAGCAFAAAGFSIVTAYELVFGEE